MRGARTIFMLIGLTLVAAGCATTGQLRPLGGATTAGAADASASPTPSTVIFPRATLLAMAKSALIPPTGLAVLGSPPLKEDDDVDYVPGGFCGNLSAGSTSGLHVATKRSWDSANLYVQQTSHAYAKPAVGAMNDVRQQVTACTAAYANPSTKEVEKIASVVDLPLTSGLDGVYGVCWASEAPNKETYNWCTGYLARGHILIEIALNYGGSVNENNKRLKQVAPVAAAVLLTVK